MEDHKKILQDVLDLGYGAIKILHTTIHKATQEGLDKLDYKDRERLDIMTNVMILVNDILQPAHDISKTMLNESESKFIDYLIDLAKKSKEFSEQTKALNEKEKESNQDKV